MIAVTHQKCLRVPVLFLVFVLVLLLPFSNLHFHLKRCWQFPFGDSRQLSSCNLVSSLLHYRAANQTAAGNQLTFRFDLKCSNYQHYKRWTAPGQSTIQTMHTPHSRPQLHPLPPFQCPPTLPLFYKVSIYWVGVPKSYWQLTLQFEL